MPLFHLAIALLSAISPVAADQVSILQVSSAVSSATSSFAPAVIYAEPTESASSALASSSTAKVAPQAVAATPAAAVAPSPYWLESITHQGISAFNSNPANYQVFRNVKSFGAKGKTSVLAKQFKSNWSQAMDRPTILLQFKQQCRQVDAVPQVPACRQPRLQPLYTSPPGHTSSVRRLSITITRKSSAIRTTCLC